MMPGRLRSDRVRAIAGARKEALARVAGSADVVGAMVGLKLKGGRRTNTLGITFLVRHKKPRQDLRTGELIPDRMKLAGMAVATDVLEWPAMTEQSLEHASLINDMRTQGSLTCFARSAAGDFGLSCAHCLKGADGNPATPSPVAMYSPELDRYLPAGESSFAVYSPGPGAASNFGYLDCGLFILEDAALLDRAAKAKPVETVEAIETLLGKTLTATSSIRTPDFSDQRRAATVIAVNVEALWERCDLVLLAEAPGTFHGDSGMLWQHQGRAAAVHARGEVMPPLTGSRLITAMSARRVETVLGIQLAVG